METNYESTAALALVWSSSLLSQSLMCGVRRVRFQCNIPLLSCRYRETRHELRQEFRDPHPRLLLFANYLGGSGSSASPSRFLRLAITVFLTGRRRYWRTGKDLFAHNPARSPASYALHPSSLIANSTSRQAHVIHHPSDSRKFDVPAEACLPMAHNQGPDVGDLRPPDFVFPSTAGRSKVVFRAVDWREKHFALYRAVCIVDSFAAQSEYLFTEDIPHLRSYENT